MHEGNEKYHTIMEDFNVLSQFVVDWANIKLRVYKTWKVYLTSWSIYRIFVASVSIYSISLCHLWTQFTPKVFYYRQF